MYKEELMPTLEGRLLEDREQISLYAYDRENQERRFQRTGIQAIGSAVEARVQLLRWVHIQVGMTEIYVGLEIPTHPLRGDVPTGDSRPEGLVGDCLLPRVPLPEKPNWPGGDHVNAALLF